MRVIAEIPHPQIKISIFYMNQKYIIKFEMYNLEQTYKLSELDYIIRDVEDVKKAIACLLFSGSKKVLRDKTKLRG